MEKKIVNQKIRESNLADVTAKDIERAYEYVLSEVGKLYRYKDRTYVQNTVANELKIVYNELVDIYPEYEDELYELIPNKYDEDLITIDRYIKIVCSIAMLVFIKSFLEHMFGEFKDYNDFNLYKDNPVLGYKLIDRLTKNVKHLIYIMVAWTNDFLTTGKLDDSAFKITRAIISWFKAIYTDYITYYTRYELLWDLHKRNVKTYTFYTSEDERVCSECGELHEKSFDVDKAIVGSNFPPIHNRCRCWIMEDKV